MLCLLSYRWIRTFLYYWRCWRTRPLVWRLSQTWYWTWRYYRDLKL